HPSFSRDGRTIAVGSFDPTARVFDVHSGALVHTYRGHSGSVEHVVFSADGSRLLTSSVDGTARLWDTDATTEIRRFVHGDSVRDAVLSPTGTEVYTSSADGTARRWSARGEEFTFQAGDGEVTGLAFSPDGKLLASAAGDSTRIYDLTNDRFVVDSKILGSRLVAYSPTGDSVLAVSRFRTSLLDALTGEEVRNFSHAVDPGGGTSAASFSADGTLVLGAIPDTFGEVGLFDAATGDQVGIFPLETAVLSVDGSKVAGWARGLYSIIDARTNDTVMSVGLGQVNARPIDVEFSPDGTRIVTGDHDNVLRVRDALTGDTLLQMPGHASPIRQVRVSADGAYALTASDDGSARLWNLDTGSLVRLFAGHDQRAVTSIAISPDGHTVAVGSADGSVVVTSSSQEELATSVCARLTRDLTDAERVAYGIEDTTPTCP
ncbi:MAG: hypothetical protein ABIP53_07450, partial [Candidatus Limnocylindrales bacterium]